MREKVFTEVASMNVFRQAEALSKSSFSLKVNEDVKRPQNVGVKAYWSDLKLRKQILTMNLDSMEELGGNDGI